MKDDDFKLLRGFGDGRTNGRTDICDCRVAFATEKFDSSLFQRDRSLESFIDCLQKLCPKSPLLCGNIEKYIQITVTFRGRRVI